MRYIRYRFLRAALISAICLPLISTSCSTGRKKADTLRTAVSMTLLSLTTKHGFLTIGDSVVAKFGYQNTSRRDLRAFKGTLVFRDMLGQQLDYVSIEVLRPLKLGQAGLIEKELSFYSMKDKKLQDVRVSWVPSKVLFTDGSLVALENLRASEQDSVVVAVRVEDVVTPGEQKPSVEPEQDPDELALGNTKLVKYDWHRVEELFNDMTADFVIRNDGDLPVKEIKVTCTHSAPGGIVVDSNTRTIDDTIAPHTTRRFQDFKMGLMDGDATRSTCEIRSVAVNF